MILAIDFETGGTDPQRHAPISIGLAVMDGSAVVAADEWLIGPARHWKTGKIVREYNIPALAVSGIRWADILAAPSPSQVVAGIRAWVDEHEAQDLAIVAYRASFDHAFFETLLSIAHDWRPDERGIVLPPLSPLRGGWYCAMHLFRFHHPESRGFRLDDAAAHYGFARESERHGAREDAMLAGRVWDRLLQERS